jgi:hypothetical protein
VRSSWDSLGNSFRSSCRACESRRSFALASCWGRKCKSRAALNPLRPPVVHTCPTQSKKRSVSLRGGCTLNELHARRAEGAGAGDVLCLDSEEGTICRNPTFTENTTQHNNRKPHAQSYDLTTPQLSLESKVFESSGSQVLRSSSLVLDIAHTSKFMMPHGWYCEYLCDDSIIVNHCIAVVLTLISGPGACCT